MKNKKIIAILLVVLLAIPFFSVSTHACIGCQDGVLENIDAINIDIRAALDEITLERAIAASFAALPEQSASIRQILQSLELSDADAEFLTLSVMASITELAETLNVPIQRIGVSTITIEDFIDSSVITPHIAGCAWGDHNWRYRSSGPVRNNPSCIQFCFSATTTRHYDCAETGCNMGRTTTSTVGPFHLMATTLVTIGGQHHWMTICVECGFRP
ncbi:MAG: hypothetical protein FWC95_06885 [Defluviitaleaceae bacterium]|nr:hypothetical protein [Defluviitaleaceae bacterium]